jgi:heptosyltransferase-2
VLGYPHIVQLAEAGHLVNKARRIEARNLAGFFARGGNLAEDLADYFSEFDIIISYLYDPDHIFETNVRQCTPAMFIAGSHRAEDQARVPAAKVYLQPLERLAIFDADPVPRLTLTCPEGQGATRARSERPLALHPGSGSERKNWPEPQWAELLQFLAQSTPHHLLLVGGEAEGERLQRLAAALPPQRTRVLQSAPLAELARHLAGCRAFIGHDSGITHLAAALGLPGLVLWGHTVEEVWRPPSEKMVLLRHREGLSALALETVIGALNDLLVADGVKVPEA